MAGISERERIVRLETRAKELETVLQQLGSYIDLILKTERQDKKSARVQVEAQQLELENQQLRAEAERLQQRLVELEIRNGIIQVSVPSKTTPTVPPTTPPQPQAPPTNPNGPPKQKGTGGGKKGNTSGGERGAEGGKEGGVRREKKVAVAAAVDVSRLDFRIGHILNVKRHPDADTLYVEEIDVGEERPRTVCTGIVAHVPIEEMEDRTVIVMCNLKPVKMRGILSEAMVMCASSPEKYEVLDPPPGSLPGDRITCEGYTGTPDGQLNPKKKIFEQIKPDLRTNDEGVACYKGIPFTVEGKGVCRAATMRNSGIE